MEILSVYIDFESYSITKLTFVLAVALCIRF